MEVSRDEGRCLITLDLDIGSPLLFRPSNYQGIVVLRLPRKPSYDDLIVGMNTLLGGLVKEEVKGKLWVIQRGRIRIYQEEIAE